MGIAQIARQIASMPTIDLRGEYEASTEGMVVAGGEERAVVGGVGREGGVPQDPAPGATRGEV